MPQIESPALTPIGSVVQNINMSVTVNATGGTKEQNEDLAQQVGRQMRGVAPALVTKEIRRQMRPGGLLAGGRR